MNNQNFVSNFVHQTKSVSKGTLTFWDGHVGVMINETEVVHSNMYHFEFILKNYLIL